MEPLVTVLVGSASWARLGLALRRSCDGESGTGLIILLRRKAGRSIGSVRGDGSRSAESDTENRFVCVEQIVLSGG